VFQSFRTTVKLEVVAFATINNKMSTDYEFQGWLGHSPEAVKGKMEWGAFEPKKWTEDDVDIQISHCGVCGSDLHVLSSGWGETPYRKSLTAPQTDRV
jgi:hypothetical protein